MNIELIIKVLKLFHTFCLRSLVSGFLLVTNLKIIFLAKCRDLNPDLKWHLIFIQIDDILSEVAVRRVQITAICAFIISISFRHLGNINSSLPLSSVFSNSCVFLS